jgi:hypothetical protein
MDLLIRFVDNFKGKIDFGLALLIRVKKLGFMDEEIKASFGKKDILIRKIH